MTREEKIKYLKLLEEKQLRKPIWEPQAKDPKRPDIVLPQAVAYNSTATIIGYGGSAGGGKTDYAIGKSLTDSERAIIYRKHYADFEGIESRFVQLIGSKYIKRGTRYEVKPPKGTRGIKADSIIFASLDTEEKDREKYQGRPYDKVIFDEVTQLKLETVEYLMQWNRSTNPDVTCQVIMTFNPPTRPEGTWVKRYFAPWLDKTHKLYGKVESGQVLHRVTLPNSDGKTSSYHWFFEPMTLTEHPSTNEPLGYEIQTKSITFVRSSLADNLYLRDTDYETTLRQSSDPAMVRMMLDGDFEEDMQDGMLSIFKPQHWAKSEQRYNDLNYVPNRPPDCVAIDAALGGDDMMVIQVGYRERINGKEHYIYPPPIAISGAALKSDIAQYEWVLDQIPDILEAGVIVIDVLGGAGQPIHAALEREMFAKKGDANHVIAFKGGERYNYRAIDDWEANEPTTPFAMNYANNISCAWQTAAAAQQHTETCISTHDDRRRECLARNYANLDKTYQIEAKEQFKRRLGNSPDFADAYVMCAHGLHRLFGNV